MTFSDRRKSLRASSRSFNTDLSIVSVRRKSFTNEKCYNKITTNVTYKSEENQRVLVRKRKRVNELVTESPTTYINSQNWYGILEFNVPLDTV